MCMPISETTAHRVRLKRYEVPKDINYIACFLTFYCGLGCSYCINRQSTLTQRKSMSPQDWAIGLARLRVSEGLPVTLQGGEPSCYSGFYELLEGLPLDLKMDLLTNGEFDIDEFMSRTPPVRFKRDAKYASIRFSFHAEKMNPLELICKVAKMQKNGYSVGIWYLDHPAHKAANQMLCDLADWFKVDCRRKEFLGWHNKTLYGTYRYEGAVEAGVIQKCECRTSEILIAPDGKIHRCHADLYAGRNSIGHILDEELPDLTEWRYCDQFGTCNACDLKVKNNRFQEFGHSSVEIRNVRA